MTMNFSELPEFQKELQQLGKKYRSLPSDLKEFCKIIAKVPLGNSKHFHVITKTEQCVIMKARLFCKYLKGSSLRIIYSYFAKQQQVDFLEVYKKGRQDNENCDRLEQYINRQSNS